MIWFSFFRFRLDDIKKFEQVLNLEQYKSDPMKTISNHIEYLVRDELI